MIGWRIAQVKRTIPLMIVMMSQDTMSDGEQDLQDV